jgi:hypothetical protein
MLTSRQSDSSSSSATPIHFQERVVGLLIEDGEHRYRFAALDAHFGLLDGSRFGAPQRAMAAVSRLSRFIDRPLAANEA